MGRDYRHESSIPAVSKGVWGTHGFMRQNMFRLAAGCLKPCRPEGKVRLLSESLARAFHDATFTEWALFALARTGNPEKWSAAQLHPCEQHRHQSAHGVLVETTFALEQ